MIPRIVLGRAAFPAFSGRFRTFPGWRSALRGEPHPRPERRPGLAPRRQRLGLTLCSLTR